MSYKVPLNVATYNNREIDFAKEVLDSGFLTMGSLCQGFEHKFGKVIGRNSCFVNSGSSANLLAFSLLQYRSSQRNNRSTLDSSFKREVIVPALTWSTTVWPIIQAGFTPVFVDSNPETLQVSAQAIHDAITENTVAICVVHVLGNACDMATIKGIADAHKLTLIEDCCESLGTKYQDKIVGSFGDLSTFSFFFSHHITTIEGGAVCAKGDLDNEVIRAMRSHGWTRHGKAEWTAEVAKQYPDLDPRFLFVSLGYNLRPTELNAAFGIKQLDVLESLNRKRASHAQVWTEALKGLDNGVVPMKVTEGCEPALFGFPVMCETKKRRNDLRKYLEDNGVETRPIIAGNLTRHPAFSGEIVTLPHRISGTLTGADEVTDRGLFWGVSPYLTDAQVEMVADLLREF